ncbi:hypothetical protein VII00023_18524, partial [Vibrio ichthyoenteri ATCC 700023]
GKGYQGKSPIQKGTKGSNWILVCNLGIHACETNNKNRK